MDILLAFLGWFFGAVAAIAVIIWLERLRSPRLTLADPVPNPPHQVDIPPRGPFQNDWRSLRVVVNNELLRPWANWWLVRLPAQQCRADITFLRSTDASPIFQQPMTGRWASGAPEPRVAHVQTASGQTVPVLLNPQELKPALDLYPGDSLILDVAIRVDGENDCYGWNDETYYYSNWRNPNRQLPKGLYLVEVTV